MSHPKRGGLAGLADLICSRTAVKCPLCVSRVLYTQTQSIDGNLVGRDTREYSCLTCLAIDVQGFSGRPRHKPSNQRDVHDILLLAAQALNKVLFPANRIVS